MTNSNKEASEHTTRHTGDPVLEMVDSEMRRRGFLGEEDPSIAKIIDDDSSGLARLGLEMDDLCDRLWALYEEGTEGLGDPITIDGKYQVEVREDRGIIACPWRDHYAARKAIVYAYNLDNRVKLTFSVLGLHMICAHGFFQAKGNPFRINPSELRDFFMK